MSNDIKQAYLVANDYGMGGLWGVMLARSEEEIAAIYPELAVVHDRPKWMTAKRYAELTETPYDIDGAPWGLLNALLVDRERQRARLAIKRELILYSSFYDNARKTERDRYLQGGDPEGHGEQNCGRGGCRPLDGHRLDNIQERRLHYTAGHAE